MHYSKGTANGWRKYRMHTTKIHDMQKSFTKVPCSHCGKQDKRLTLQELSSFSFIWTNDSVCLGAATVGEHVTSTVSTTFWWNRKQEQWKNVLHQQRQQNFDETEIPAVEERVTSTVSTKSEWNRNPSSGRTCYINSINKMLMKQKSQQWKNVLHQQCWQNQDETEIPAVEERVTSTVLTKCWWNRNQQ